MKKLLALLSLFGCTSTPIEYALKPTLGGLYEVSVSSENTSIDITTLRNRAFIIADNTCKSFGKSWGLEAIYEASSSNSQRVHLVFVCQAPNP